MMKESRKSLKIYFIIIGVLATLSGLGFIVAPNMLEKILSLYSLIFGILFLYYGIKLYDFLQSSPKTLTNLVMIVGIINVILYAISMQWIGVIISGLLIWYLLHNIQKLSQPHSPIPQN